MPTSLTNGDSAVPLIRAAGIRGPVIPWRDILHEGPVPAGLSLERLRAVRAAFLAQPGRLPYDRVLIEMEARDTALATAFEGDEVVLWFEHDLYDQLQLLQILDWCAMRARGARDFTLICGAEYLGSSTPARLSERFAARVAVTPAQIDLAVAAWAAFRSPDPQELVRFLARGSMALPFVMPAFRRHLQQFPSTVNGLSRTQQFGLEAIAAGPTTLRTTYRAAHQDRENPVWLGDSVFANHLEGMSQVPTPLLLVADGTRLGDSGVEGAPYWEQELQLTDAGRAVLAGQADHIALNGIDRWLGGVQLTAKQYWRWDDEREIVHLG